MIEKFNTGETPEELKIKYNLEGSQLRRAQLRMLDMLLYINKICKENNIEYRLDGGNVLGAVRHGGFIPWDDDVDIALSPENFSKLCLCLRKSNNKQYVLQNHDTDSGYYLRGCATLRDTKSEYIQNSYLHNARKYKGLQIDIFCYDINIIPLFAKISRKFDSINNKYFIGRSKIMSALFYSFPKYMLDPIFYFIGRVIGSNKYCAHSYGREWKLIPIEFVYPYSYIEFEGHKLPAPAKPKEYCEYCYKNHMNLPPIDGRSPHQATYKIWD